MPYINKFGSTDQRTADAANGASYYYFWEGLMRNFVRDNSLCRIDADFDAKKCKIRRVAQPEADDDVVNKLYMEQSVKDLRDQLAQFQPSLRIVDNLSLHVYNLQLGLDKISDQQTKLEQRLEKVEDFNLQMQHKLEKLSQQINTGHNESKD